MSWELSLNLKRRTLRSGDHRMISNVFLPDSMEVIYVPNWGTQKDGWHWNLPKDVGPRFHSWSKQYLVTKTAATLRDAVALNQGKYPKVWYFGMTQRGLAASEMGWKGHGYLDPWRKRGCLKSWKMLEALKFRWLIIVSNGLSPMNWKMSYVTYVHMEGRCGRLGSKVSRKRWWTKQRQRRRPWRLSKLPDSASSQGMSRWNVLDFANQIRKDEPFTTTASCAIVAVVGV